MEPNLLVCRSVETVNAAPPTPHPVGHHPPTPGNPGGHSHAPAPAGKSRAAIFWGISGGTILSVVGFIALALFEQYNDSLNELRNDLKHFHLTCGDLVKKEELRGRMRTTWGRIRDLQAIKITEARRESRLAQMERQVKEVEEERKELMHELQRLRERLAAVEGRQAATPIIVPGTPAAKSQAPRR
jgi:hypothetical protein